MNVNPIDGIHEAYEVISSLAKKSSVDRFDEKSIESVNVAFRVSGIFNTCDLINVMDKVQQNNPGKVVDYTFTFRDSFLTITKIEIKYFNRIIND